MFRYIYVLENTIPHTKPNDRPLYVVNDVQWKKFQGDEMKHILFIFSHEEVGGGGGGGVHPFYKNFRFLSLIIILTNKIWSCFPPPTDGYASDEEVGDDNIGYAGNIEFPGDIVGIIEIHRRHVDSDSDTDEEENPSAKSNAKKRYQSFFVQA